MNRSTQDDWLRLVEAPQKETLTRLMKTAPRSAEELVHQMLWAPPYPADEADAQLRLSAVINYLTRGYRVGDLHPTMETK